MNIDLNLAYLPDSAVLVENYRRKGAQECATVKEVMVNFSEASKEIYTVLYRVELLRRSRNKNALTLIVNESQLKPDLQ